MHQCRLDLRDLDGIIEEFKTSSEVSKQTEKALSDSKSVLEAQLEEKRVSLKREREHKEKTVEQSRLEKIQLDVRLQDLQVRNAELVSEHESLKRDMTRLQTQNRTLKLKSASMRGLLDNLKAEKKSQAKVYEKSVTKLEQELINVRATLSSENVDSATDSIEGEEMIKLELDTSELHESLIAVQHQQSTRTMALINSSPVTCHSPVSPRLTQSSPLREESIVKQGSNQARKTERSASPQPRIEETRVEMSSQAVGPRLSLHDYVNELEYALCRSTRKYKELKTAFRQTRDYLAGQMQPVRYTEVRHHVLEITPVQLVVEAHVVIDNTDRPPAVREYGASEFERRLQFDARLSRR